MIILLRDMRDKAGVRQWQQKAPLSVGGAFRNRSLVFAHEFLRGLVKFALTAGRAEIACLALILGFRGRSFFVHTNDLFSIKELHTFSFVPHTGALTISNHLLSQLFSRQAASAARARELGRR